MPVKFTVLFAPMDAYGHFNACIGLAEPLRDRGHNVVFATPKGWKGKLAELGFHEESLSHSDEDTESEPGGPAAKAIEMYGKLAAGMAKSPHEQIKQIFSMSFPRVMKATQAAEQGFQRIVSKVKPDVIVVDSLFTNPALVNSGIPWILSSSLAPLGISNKNVPPAFSGLPTNGNREEWKSFAEDQRTEFHEIFTEHKSWIVQNGGEPLEYNHPYFINYSPYANIYMFPKELDYTEFRPNPPNWHHFETFIRSSKEHFEIPPQLQALPGKLVYLSMGSMGSSEVGLMQRLVSILGKSPHRFIVSKGQRGDQYELPGNMWGANFLPQTKVLPLVDLVITHGGNNTVTESFYFGKPCIVLPLFGDQHDNAQRIQEVGLGLRFPPYQVSGAELLPGIENILADDKLLKRMHSISERIQSTNTKALTADLIESVARKGAFK